MIADLIAAKKQCQLATLFLADAFETQDQELVAQAINLYLEALDLCPELEEPYLALAYIAWKANQLPQAIVFLQKLLSMNPVQIQAKGILDQIRQEMN